MVFGYLFSRASQEPTIWKNLDDWREEPPTRDAIAFACALCHLVYWWRGPDHMTIEALRKAVLALHTKVFDNFISWLSDVGLPPRSADASELHVHAWTATTLRR